MSEFDTIRAQMAKRVTELECAGFVVTRTEIKARNGHVTAADIWVVMPKVLDGRINVNVSQ
jgi:hypothetical protein